VDDGLDGRYTAAVSATFWNDLADYAILKLHLAGGIASVKLYDEDGAEPAWMASGAVGYGGHATTQVAFNAIGDGTNRRAVQMIYIDVQGSCTPVTAGGVAGTPTSPGGYGCVTATRTSSTVYAVPSAFIPNSLAVWRDGLFQRPATDFTENSDHLGVTFSDPVASTSVIRICYFTEAPT
jgi:hypothetical protein